MTLRPATPKERVLAVWPEAIAQHGAVSGLWWIAGLPDSRSEWFTDEDSAWADAARRIEKPKERA